MRQAVLLVAVAILLALGVQSFAEFGTDKTTSVMTPPTPSIAKIDVTSPTFRVALPWEHVVWGIIILTTLSGIAAFMLLSLAVLYTILEVLGTTPPLIRRVVSRFKGLQDLLHLIVGDISHARREALREGRKFQAWRLVLASTLTIIMNVSFLAVMAVRDRVLGVLRVEVS